MMRDLESFYVETLNEVLNECEDRGLVIDIIEPEDAHSYIIEVNGAPRVEAETEADIYAFLCGLIVCVDLLEEEDYFNKGI